MNTNKPRPRHTRARQERTTVSDARAINPLDWKRVLRTVLDLHNGKHAHRDTQVSHRTMEARANGLFRIFGQLRALGYRISPLNIGGRHIATLMRYWTCDPALLDELARGPEVAGKLAPLAQPYSAAYIQLQLGILRVFAGWIGKPGMVLTASAYVEDMALVQRRTYADADKSWSGNGVDIDAVLAAVASRDPYVGLQLEVMIAFGLRRKEAVMFSPHLADVPWEALPRGRADLNQYISFLRIKRGTKGARLRYTAIRTEAQRRALERARHVARGPGAHIGRPGLSLKQSLALFSNVLAAAGVTRRALGITPHGLRHEFAGDLFYDLTGVVAPVRGLAPGADRDTVRAAYLEVAQQLGHGRPQISSAYLGREASLFPRDRENPQDPGRDQDRDRPAPASGEN